MGIALSIAFALSVFLPAIANRRAARDSSCPGEISSAGGVSEGEPQAALSAAAAPAARPPVSPAETKKASPSAAESAPAGGPKAEGAEFLPEKISSEPGAPPIGRNRELDFSEMRRLENSAQRLGLTREEVAYISATMRAFEDEAEALIELGSEDAQAARLLRERSIETIEELRARIGAAKINHLMSEEVLRPIYQYAYSRRPTIYPPPEPDPD
jgi:hypothetical protein